MFNKVKICFYHSFPLCCTHQLNVQSDGGKSNDNRYLIFTSMMANSPEAAKKLQIIMSPPSCFTFVLLRHYLFTPHIFTLCLYVSSILTLSLKFFLHWLNTTKTKCMNTATLIQNSIMWQKIQNMTSLHKIQWNQSTEWRSRLWNEQLRILRCHMSVVKQPQTFKQFGGKWWNPCLWPSATGISTILCSLNTNKGTLWWPKAESEMW